MNILIATDGSEFSQAAINEVLARPWPEDTRFLVIMVVEPLTADSIGMHGGSPIPLAIEPQKELVKAAQSIIGEAVTALRGRFDDVEGKVQEGYIKDRILDTARGWPADLIVVGSHGRKGVTKFLMGSVSEAVLAQAPCSVEIVKIKDDGRFDSSEETGLRQ